MRNETVFPYLQEDLISLVKSKKSVCIVTIDIAGPIRNGGVGTACASLAECLVRAGHDVTIILANGISDDDKNFHLWQQEYLNKGIHLHSLHEPEIRIQAFYHARFSYAVYLELKNKKFDVIHFPDLCGLGYYSLLAKTQGLAFKETEICVTLHGPHEWVHQGNHGIPVSLDEVQLYYLERKSVEMADILIAPTQYALGWAQQHGWHLPQRSFVQLLPKPINSETTYKNKRKHFDEIVFFGRIETRKGITEFCQAIEMLPKKFLIGKKITFLGKWGYLNGEWAVHALKEKSKKWDFNFKFINDFNQSRALDYLRSRSALAVMASKSETMGYTLLECLENNIPFIASDISAFREVLPKKYHKTHLFKLDSMSLKNKILEVSQKGLPETDFNQKLQQVEHAWAHWHDYLEITQTESTPLSLKQMPTISVIITHKDRPRYLVQAVESILKQQYAHFEIIIADDGSQKPDSIKTLKKLDRLLKKQNKGYVIKQKASTGPGYLRNWAAKSAQHDYLLFMDDDNIAKDNELEVFAQVALKTKADILTCCFERFYQKNPPQNMINTVRWVPMGDDLNLAAFFNTIGDMNCLVKKSVFEALGGLNATPGAGSEDYNFFVRAIAKGYLLKAIPEALFFYRDHKSNYSAKTDGFKTISLQVSALGQVLPTQNLAPLFGLLHAWKFALKKVENPYTNYGDLINPKRTDLLLEPLHYQKRLLTIGPGKNLSHIKFKNAKVTIEKQTFFVSSKKDSKPEILFNASTLKKYKSALIKIDFLSFDQTEVLLTYLSKQGKPLSEQKKTLLKGKCSVFFKITNAYDYYGLQLTLNDKKTHLYIQKIELFV